MYGVGFITDPKAVVKFTPVSDRICTITTKAANKHRVNIISAYAPTLETTNKTPEITTQFYEELESLIKLTNSRDTLIIGGDFNAKTKLGNKMLYENYNKIIGKYGHGMINKNGHILLEFAKRNDLRLTNTFFKHKPSHRTTWECPQRKSEHIDTKSGRTRRNPYRNQIDYILIKNKDNVNIYDSRSYGGMSTKSDHKPVITELEIKWPFTKSKKSAKKINYDLLQDKNHRREYHLAVTKHLENQPEKKTNQDRWNNIINATKQSAIETLGFADKKEKYQNPDIKTLSTKQKQLNIDMNSTNSLARRDQLRQERNRLLTEIHNMIRLEETNKI